MSRIEQIITEMEDYLDGCKTQSFSNGKRIVIEKDVMDDMLVELRMRTPEEIKKYQKIIANKDEILTEAKRQADSTIVEANRQKEEMISQSEIMKAAYAQADQLMNETQAEAQRMIDEAAAEADSIRQSAMDYTDSLLSGLQDFLGHSMDSMQNRFNSFFSQLSASYQVVAANRKELLNQNPNQPEEPDENAEEIPDIEIEE